MLKIGVNALRRGRSKDLGKTKQVLEKPRKSVSGMLLGFGLAGYLAGCAQPAPVAVVLPPPPPVGHLYQTMVQVPPPIRHIRMTPTMQAQVQQAFNVVALKSALVVAALSCNQQDQYDAFMTAFQPHVLAEQHVMDAYFKRSSGYYGQAKEDDFVTLLANNQSVVGISQGAMFCVNNSAEYHAVLALKSPADLDAFATDLPPGAPADAAPVAVASGATVHSVKPVAVADTAP